MKVDDGRIAGIASRALSRFVKYVQEESREEESAQEDDKVLYRWSELRGLLQCGPRSN